MNIIVQLTEQERLASEAILAESNANPEADQETLEQFLVRHIRHGVLRQLVERYLVTRAETRLAKFALLSESDKQSVDAILDKTAGWAKSVP